MQQNLLPYHLSVQHLAVMYKMGSPVLSTVYFWHDSKHILFSRIHYARLCNLSLGVPIEFDVPWALGHSMILASRDSLSDNVMFSSCQGDSRSPRSNCIASRIMVKILRRSLKRR